MKKINFIILIIILPLFIFSQTSKVSVKTGIKKGKLDNGITYYIYSNPIYNESSKGGKVSFYLIQNVGAVLEEDSQNGLAHFLEHMAFNGTKNFPNKTMNEKFYARSLGYSINAYTTMNETVYYFTGIPTKDKAFCDECLLMLHDWTDYLTLDSLAIEKERPVILEEMRLRNTVNWHINEELKPITHNFSKYSKRNIIGPAENIANFKKEELYKFYHDWYRTDLQAVVVIGDVNATEIEGKIKRLFSTIKPLKNPKERYHVKINDNDQTLYKQIRDKRIGSGTINIEIRHNYEQNNRNRLFDGFINALINDRVSEMLKRDSLNFYDASISKYPFAYGYCAYNMSVNYKKDRAKHALSQIFGLHKEILKNGFTKEEYNKTKTKILKGLKESKKYYHYYPHDTRLQMIKSNFIDNVDILDPSEMINLFEEIIKNTSLEDIKLHINKLYQGTNKSIAVIGNTTDTLLTKEEILEIEKKSIAKKYISKDQEEKNINKLEIVNEDLENVGIGEKKMLDILGAKKWILDNGATIIYKQCDDVPNAINIYASSLGGSSKYKGKKLKASKFFTSYNKMFGIKGIKFDDLEKIKKEKNIKSFINLTYTREEIALQGEYRNVEEMFELLYSYFEKPDFYKSGFDKSRKKLIDALRDQQPTYKLNLRDSIEILRYGKNRFIKANETVIINISFNEIKEIYEDRFKDASNFNFYIVGGLSEKKARKLSQKYIGNINTFNLNEKIAEYNNPFPQGCNQKTYTFDMIVPKAGFYCYLNEPREYSYKEKYINNFIRLFLRDKLQKVIRQLLRGTYNVTVNQYHENALYKNSGFEVSFECSPDKIDELSKATHLTIELIKDKGATKEDFDILKSMINPPKNIIRGNSNYIKTLFSYIEYGEDKSEITFYEDIHEAVKYEDFNTQLKEFLNNVDILTIISLPKK